MNDVSNELRRRIEHEDNLMNQRISWLVSSQSFLLTAVAICINGSTSRTPSYEAMAQLVLNSLPWTGIVCSALALLGTIGGQMAMAQLRETFARLQTGTSLPLQGTLATRLMGQIAFLAMPIAFLVVWIILLFKTT